MFVKHIIKTPTCFGHNCLTIFRGPSFVLSAVTAFSTCLRRQVVYLVCRCMLSMRVRAWCTCLWDVWLWTVVNSSQPNIPQTSTSGTHTHRQHTATYQISNLTTQTSTEGSKSTKHERQPPEDGQTIVTETCRVLMMCFTNIFNNLEF